MWERVRDIFAPAHDSQWGVWSEGGGGVFCGRRRRRRGCAAVCVCGMRADILARTCECMLCVSTEPTECTAVRSHIVYMSNVLIGARQRARRN